MVFNILLNIKNLGSANPYDIVAYLKYNANGFSGACCGVSISLLTVISPNSSKRL